MLGLAAINLCNTISKLCGFKAEEKEGHQPFLGMQIVARPPVTQAAQKNAPPLAGRVSVGAPVEGEQ